MQVNSLGFFCWHLFLYPLNILKNSLLADESNKESCYGDMIFGNEFDHILPLASQIYLPRNLKALWILFFFALLVSWIHNIFCTFFAILKQLGVIKGTLKDLLDFFFCEFFNNLFIFVELILFTSSFILKMSTPCS